VLINQSYYAKVSKTARADGEKNYLAECLQTATWLVRALDQRARTILKVSTEIVRQQDGFFTQGVQHLRPLNLKTVADAISMHESTVSRVTANKYMATSRGIFELKYFFTSSISSSDGGEAHSAEAVRHRIKQLIDAEDGQDVLSDDTIVEKLREAGIDIATPNRCQIPGSHANPFVGPAASGQAGSVGYVTVLRIVGRATAA
jgi:RNA polymerase sigma-54 factor